MPLFQCYHSPILELALSLVHLYIIAGLANFNLSGVSSRASASAKTMGSFFGTAFSKASASVKEAGTKIKETVEKAVSNDIATLSVNNCVMQLNLTEIKEKLRYKRLS